ncbi:hypothetical protein Tco_0168889 [Tanacetum coccineum]
MLFRSRQSGLPKRSQTSYQMSLLMTVVNRIIGAFINRGSYRLCGKDVEEFINPSYFTAQVHPRPEFPSFCRQKTISGGLSQIQCQEQKGKSSQASQDILLVKSYSDPDFSLHQNSKINQAQDKETTEATPPAKRAKAGKVVKKQTLKRSQQLVDEVVDEGIPLTEPGEYSASRTSKVVLQTKGQVDQTTGYTRMKASGPNPGNDTMSQTLSTPGVMLRNQTLKHKDAKATVVTSQPPDNG